MATSRDYVQYVCEQLRGAGAIRFRKMFGEYLIYVDDKPMVLVCDDTAYVKTLDCLAEKMRCADRGVPYEGAKEHYILDVDDSAFCREVILLMEPCVPLPKPRKKPAR